MLLVFIYKSLLDRMEKMKEIEKKKRTTGSEVRDKVSREGDGKRGMVALIDEVMEEEEG